MTIRDAYSAWAPTYDSVDNPTRDLDQVVTRESLAHRRFAHILEIGCGTGKNTAFLAEIGNRVHALDFSEGMLEQARAKISAANVTFQVADLTLPWPCADRSFQLIVCNLVLEHIADLAWIFAEAYRCLTPGGQLFVCELHPFRQYDGVRATFSHGDTSVEIPAFVHHISDFLDAAAGAGLRLERLTEWWRQPDRAHPPQLIALLFTR